MKKDQYIPHDVGMRSNSDVFHMVESEGAAGYGLYWGIMEYLRSQNNYRGDIRAIKGIARQLKCRADKAVRVLEEYGLFVIENATFYSPHLNEKMLPLEKKRAQRRTPKPVENVSANEQTLSQNEETLSEKSNSLLKNEESLLKPSCNSLEINLASDKVKESKEKESKENTTSSISSSSVAEEVAVVEEALPVSFVPAWERYVNELQEDEQWKELVAMRSGLKEKFSVLFPRIVEAFKRHVRSIGNEGQILSPGDAKHYFWFFMSPSSPTYKNLILELQKPLDRGKYKHEDYDPTTGQRSYCGVPIPADAPPRPNGQAVWSEDRRKWVY